MKRRMSPIVISVGIAWVVFLVWVAYGYFSIRGVQEPAYTVIEQSGGIEIREYDSYLAAQVSVDGPWESALNRGFAVLADYIFGNNIGSASLDMTVPVNIETEPEGTRIAMTVPVTTQEKDGRYLISFVMPRGYSLESLPRPNNPAIRIVEVPSGVVAVRRFSGSVREQRAQREEATLRDAINASGLLATGSPRLAQYNPPWTPPFMRRNEIMIPVRRP